jgi:hypothetical protein
MKYLIRRFRYSQFPQLINYTVYNYLKKIRAVHAMDKANVIVP